MVPYFQALCIETGECLLNQYKDFCYEQIGLVLSSTDLSDLEFEAYWSSIVANEFGLDSATLNSIYSYSTDQWNTNSNTRAMWKSACARGVSGTPTVFINGVKLDNAPGSHLVWMNTLNNVYDSQYHAATQVPKK